MQVDTIYMYEIFQLGELSRLSLAESFIVMKCFHSVIRMVIRIAGFHAQNETITERPYFIKPVVLVLVIGWQLAT